MEQRDSEEHIKKKQKVTKPPMFEILPDDIILEIIARLPTISTLRFCATCSRMWNLKQRVKLRHVSKCKRYLDHNHIEAALKKSARLGDQELVDFFIRKGVSSWNSAISEAAENGHTELVKFFLEKGGSSTSGLKGAIVGNQDHLINFFISNTQANWNECLKTAAMCNRKDVAEMLVQKGANEFNQPLARAAKAQSRELIDYFVECGASNWNVALYGACMSGNQEIVDFFLEKGADNLDWGALGATKEGHSSIVEYLFSKGANLTDNIMYEAIKSKNAPILQLAWKKDSSVFSENVWNAVGDPEFVDCLQFLLNEVVSDTVKQQILQETLEMALSSGEIKFFKSLLELGADPKFAFMRGASIVVPEFGDVALDAMDQPDLKQVLLEAIAEDICFPAAQFLVVRRGLSMEETKKQATEEGNEVVLNNIHKYLTWEAATESVRKEIMESHPEILDSVRDSQAQGKD